MSTVFIFLNWVARDGAPKNANMFIILNTRNTEHVENDRGQQNAVRVGIGPAEGCSTRRSGARGGLQKGQEASASGAAVVDDVVLAPAAAAVLGSLRGRMGECGVQGRG